MKKLLLLTVSSFLAATSFSQDSLYAKVYSVAAGYKVNAIANAPNGRVVQVGNTNYDDAALALTDSLGNVLNASSYTVDGQPANSFDFSDVITASDGNFVATGSVLLQGVGATVGIVVKTDNQGNVLWSKMILNAVPGFFKGNSVIESSENTYWVVGSEEQTGETVILELDTDGTQLQSFSYKVTGERLEVLKMLELNPTTLAFVGAIFNSSGGSKGLVFATDKTGTMQWTNTVNNLRFYDAVADTDAIRIVGGNMQADPSLINVSPTGQLQSIQTYSFNISIENGMDIAFVYDSTIAITYGTFYSGSLIVATANTTDAESFYVSNNTTDVISREHHGIYISGNGPLYGVKSSLNFPNPHGAMLRVDSLMSLNSCLSSEQQLTVTTSNPADQTATLSTMSGASTMDLTIIRSELALGNTISCVDFYSSVDELYNSALSIYPNPGTGKVTIQLETVQSGILRICDAQGQLILERELTDLQTELDLSDLSSGMYFYSLSTHTNKVVGRGKYVLR